MSQTTSNEQEPKFSEEQELKAWDTWKQICSTQGCPDEERSILSCLIGGAIKKKLLANGISLSEIATHFRSNDNGWTLEQALANRFDTEVHLAASIDRADKRYKNADDIHTRNKKNYKNVVWDACVQSNDPPLKIIRGMLLGKTNYGSALNDIVTDIVNNEFSGYQITERLTSDGKRYKCPQKIFSDIEASELTNGKDLSLPITLQKWEKDYLKKEINSIPLVDAGILLCKAAGINLTAPTLVEFVGKEHTWIYDHWGKVVFPTFQRIFANDHFSPENGGPAWNFLLNCIFSRIEAESSNRRLLMLDEVRRLRQRI